MQVREILETKPTAAVVTIGPDQLVAEAVQALCRCRIGALLVVNESGEPVGIITERDVLRQANQNAAGFGKQPISEMMTRELICGLPDDNVDYIMQVMTHNKIRHLPIVEDRKVVGLISIGDVIKSQLDITRVENHMLKDYLHLRGDI